MSSWLETPRLFLRPFEDADLEVFLAYRNDPEVARYQGWEYPYTRLLAEDFIVKMKERAPDSPGKWLQLAIEHKASGVLIGDCAYYLLERDMRQAEIGFTVAREYQNQSYATEAVRRLLAHLFEDKGLHRVRANCDDRNLASTRLLERVGMRREAHHIESYWDNGQWTSEYWYAMLRREWVIMPL